MAELVVSRVRDYGDNPIGNGLSLATATGLVASETAKPISPTSHVSPSVRLHSPQRLTLVEISLVKQSKSPNTKTLERRERDPMRDYLRSRREGADLYIRAFQLLQQGFALVRRMSSEILEQQAEPPQAARHPLASLPMMRAQP